jgi:hypothetical protein
MANKYEDGTVFHVELFDNGSENVYEVLGISEERSDEIVELSRKAYKEEKYFTDTLKTLVEQMNHINEVIFALLVAGRMHSKGNSPEMSSAKSVEDMMSMMQMMIKLRGEK